MKHRIALALLFLTAAPAAWATDIEVTADTPARAVLQPDLLRRTGQTFPGADQIDSYGARTAGDELIAVGVIARMTVADGGSPGVRRRHEYWCMDPIALPSGGRGQAQTLRKEAQAGPSAGDDSRSTRQQTRPDIVSDTANCVEEKR